VNGLATHDARRLDLHASLLGVGQRALAVDRLAEGVDDASQEAVANGQRQDVAGGPHRLALLDVVDLAEDHRTDGCLVEVQGETERAALELEQLVDRRVGQTRHAGDAVADLEDPTNLALFKAGGEPVEVLADRFGDVRRVDREFGHGVSLSSLARMPLAGA